MKPYLCSKCDQEFNTRLEFDMHKVYCTGILIVRDDLEKLATCRIERDQQYKRAEQNGKELDVVYVILLISIALNIVFAVKVWG